jgi:uncharacterized membrane protein
VRRAGLLPVGLLAAGVALIAYSVARGGAAVGVLVVIPFVLGHSVAFAVGVLLLAAGFLTLPLAFVESEAPEPPPAPAGSTGSGISGVIVVGPFPFFFGAARNLPRWVPIAVSAIGAAVLAVWLLVAFGVVR